MAFSCLELLFVSIELALCLAGEKEENQARNKDSGESATWHKHNWSSGDCQRPCCKCCLSTTLRLMSGNMHSSRMTALFVTYHPADMHMEMYAEY